MSFYTSTFTYDGVSCEQYGLELYEVDNAAQKSCTIGSGTKIHETRISRRNDGIFYGISHNEPLEFTLVFGVTDSYLDRFDIEAVAGWLMGSKSYKWLHILQEDMFDVKYKCKITEISTFDHGLLPRAFIATVVCDSPYAYKVAPAISVNCESTASYMYYNGSNIDVAYKPKFTINVPVGTTSVSIINASKNNEEFKISGLDGTAMVITVDCKNQIIVSSKGTNLYTKCNLKFPSFKKGLNTLNITGKCTLTIPQEWYVNVGY